MSFVYGQSPPQGSAVPELGTALRTIHADRDWWKKVLVGGALWLTLLGWPVVEGHQLESIENSQRGFPTPLPRWDDIGGKGVLGIFALVIDFFYFLFPLILGGMVFFCGTLFVGLAGNGGATGVVARVTLVVPALYVLVVWAAGASAVAKQRYVVEGDLPAGLSGGLVWQLLRRPGRGMYLRARLLSLPPYLLAVALLVLSAWVFTSTTLGGLLILWLALSGLTYARLVTIQLYLAATRAAESRRFTTLHP